MGKHPKPAERELARRLRALDGMPMKEIAASVGVSVGSVSLWTRDIRLTPKQRAANDAQANLRRAAGCSATARRRRLAYQRAGRRRARDRDPTHQAGCMLYWAEGSKGKNTVVSANSDLQMMKVFARFLRDCFDLEATDFALRLNVYTGNGLSLDEIERHWLDALELPRSCLRKHTLNHFPTSSSGKKQNKLPYGVCSLIVGQTRVVQHIFGAIQEYGGFEEPRWLD